MKNLPTALMLAACLMAATACSSDDKDQQRPVITAEGIDASPSNCDSFRLGDTILFRYRFSDNEALGNYSLEIHSNHDHHTHSTEAENCPWDEDDDHTHTPSNPWVYNQSFAIPDGVADHVAELEIPIPEAVDEGEYHFMIRVTDRAGWQEIKSLSIQLVDPNE